MTIVAGSPMDTGSTTDIGVGPVLVNASDLGSSTTKGWRPPQWSSSSAYVITTPITKDGGGNVYVLTPLRVGHELALRRTEHPVQSGAAITDHAYVLPTKVVMEVGVSDAMDTFRSGMWGGSSSSTSVNAFAALQELARKRVVVKLQTRLRSYNNMLVESVAAEETSRTIAAGRFHVVFSEIFVASTQVITATTRLDANPASGKGVVTPSQPTLQTLLNYMLSAYYPAEVTSPGAVSGVKGAGTASSVPVQTIQQDSFLTRYLEGRL